MSKQINYDNNILIYKRILKDVFVPNLPSFIVAGFLMILSAGMTAYRTYLLKPAIDDVFINKNTTALLVIPLTLMVISIVLAFTSYIEHYLLNRVTIKFNAKLQEKLYRKFLSFDMDYFQNKSTHAIMNQLNDVSSLINAVNLFIVGALKQAVTMLMLAGLMFKQDYKLFFLAFFAFPIAILPVIIIGKKLRTMASKTREIEGKMGGIMGEGLNLVQLVKSNNQEEYEAERFEKAMNKQIKLSLKSVRLSLITSPMMELLGSIGAACVVFYGGMSVINGTTTAGAFFTFMAAMLTMYKPAKSTANLNLQIQVALTCAKRLYIVLDKEPKLVNVPNAKPLENVRGNIELDSVLFRYPIHGKDELLVCANEVVKLSDKPALNHLSLSIKSGTSVALVGHSGSGKSTIFNLLLRFYDPQEGEIRIDGNNIGNVTIESLRDNISVVSQNVMIFNTSVRENVAYGIPDATDEQIIEACKLANADEFIADLAEGYDTILGPNGSVLSGGQKQRISIARAILKNTPILLLDEATSALDPISEKLIQKALAKLMKDRTTVIIAHRLTTVLNCDNIFVLRDGKVVESGNHERLMEIQGDYYNLYQKQFEKNDQI